jgi:hypothetical protein
MSELDGQSDRDRRRPEPTVSELPEGVLDTYARLWQFETWLRRLVYVELRAFAGDNWTSTVRCAERSKDADKRLTHMPTPEDDPLSYAQFSELGFRQQVDKKQR